MTKYHTQKDKWIPTQEFKAAVEAFKKGESYGEKDFSADWVLATKDSSALCFEEFVVAFSHKGTVTFYWGKKWNTWPRISYLAKALGISTSYIWDTKVQDPVSLIWSAEAHMPPSSWIEEAKADMVEENANTLPISHTGEKDGNPPSFAHPSLESLALKWKGKVSTQFIACLPYFAAGISHKAGWDYVVVKDGLAVLKIKDFEIARLCYPALNIRWDKTPSTKNRAKVVAEYLGISWQDLLANSTHLGGLYESVNVIGELPLIGASKTKVTPVPKPKITPVSGKVILTFETKEEKAKTHTYTPHISTPDPTDNRMESLWGLYTKSLLPMAADFYLLAEASENATWVRFHYYTHARRLAELAAGYLAMAIGGELRHARTKTSWMTGLSKGNRRRAWEDWKGIWERLGPVDACEKAAISFNEGNWLGGYGGKAWGKVAEILGEWHSGDLSDVLFVDTAMQLQHNCGCIFNKWFTDLSGLKTLLDAKFRGSHAILLGFASVTVRRIFLNTMPKGKDELRQKWAKQFEVERVLELQ